MSTRLVIATGNPGKMREFRDALAETDLDLVSATEAGVTYEENAMMKAAHVAVATGLPALGDDSGLEVAALDGAPGVYSARFGGRSLSPGERIAHLLSKLRKVPEHERDARFMCSLVLATPEGAAVSFEGTCDGRILQGPRGEAGFGYDPVFFSLDLGRAFGESTEAEKRSVSHRGRALRAFRAWLETDEGRRILPPGPA